MRLLRKAKLFNFLGKCVFQRKIVCLRWDLNPRFTAVSTRDTCIHVHCVHACKYAYDKGGNTGSYVIVSPEKSGPNYWGLNPGPSDC